MRDTCCITFNRLLPRAIAESGRGGTSDWRIVEPPRHCAQRWWLALENASVGSASATKPVPEIWTSPFAAGLRHDYVVVAPSAIPEGGQPIDLARFAGFVSALVPSETNICQLGRFLSRGKPSRFIGTSDEPTRFRPETPERMVSKGAERYERGRMVWIFSQSIPVTGRGRRFNDPYAHQRSYVLNFKRSST
jgi:hypothetical protein